MAHPVATWPPREGTLMASRCWFGQLFRDSALLGQALLPNCVVVSTKSSRPDFCRARFIGFHFVINKCIVLFETKMIASAPEGGNHAEIRYYCVVRVFDFVRPVLWSIDQRNRERNCCRFEWRRHARRFRDGHKQCDRRRDDCRQQ